jgi:hypothetical protein
MQKFSPFKLIFKILIQLQYKWSSILKVREKTQTNASRTGSKTYLVHIPDPRGKKFFPRTLSKIDDFPLDWLPITTI